MRSFLVAVAWTPVVLLSLINKRAIEKIGKVVPLKQRIAFAKFQDTINGALHGREGATATWLPDAAALGIFDVKEC